MAFETNVTGESVSSVVQYITDALGLRRTLLLHAAAAPTSSLDSGDCGEGIRQDHQHFVECSSPSGTDTHRV
jgi:hypothetical protein